MINSKHVIKPSEKLYFGENGGLMMSDIFSLFLNDLADQIENALETEAYSEIFESLVKIQDFGEFSPISRHQFRNLNVTLIPFNVYPFFIAGNVALAHCLKKQEVVAGFDNEIAAINFISACRKLSIKPILYLGRQLSEDKDFNEKLNSLDCEYDNEKSVSLFSNPQMYAFQRFNANCQTSFFAVMDTNIGPYPFPHLAGKLASEFGSRIIKDILFPVDTMVAPITSGIEAIGAFKKSIEEDTGIKYITFEDEYYKTRQDVSCGCVTLITSSVHQEWILSPELIQWWNLGKVVRLGGGNLRKRTLMEDPDCDLPESLQNILDLASMNVNCRNIFFIVQETKPLLDKQA